MKKLLFSLFVLTLISSNGYTQEFLNWQRFTDGTAHSNDSAVTVDVEETATNVYVGGNIYNTGKGSDIVIQNFDLNGNLLWSGGYTSPLNDHLAWFVCNESPGAIYGAGNSDNGSKLNGLLIKMDMSGNLLWSKSFNGTGNVMFENVKVAPNGNIIVVGEIMLAFFVCDEIIACYDAAGNLLWSHTGSEQTGETEFNHLEIDANGNIYASGYSYNGTNEDGFIESFKSNGTPINTIAINGAGNKDDEVKGLELMNGLLYAATIGRGSGSYDKATITAYNPADFSVAWTKGYSSVNGDIDLAGIIGPETGSDILLAGVQGNFTSGTSKYLALSYNAATGAQNWVNTISRGTGYNNTATAMTVDTLGNLFITGETNLAGAQSDVYTIGYDHSGKLLWTKVFNGAVNGDDYPTSIGADANGNIFVAGTSAQSQSLAPAKSNEDFALLKYSSNFICSVPANLYSDSITSSLAWLHWDAMPEALKYKLQYRVAGGAWTSVNVTTNNKIITGLAPKTKYQWRVKTICSKDPAVSSDYSVTKSFYTLGSGFASSIYNAKDEAIASKQTGLQIFPNPATQTVNLQLNNMNESNVNVKLFDLAGKELKHYQFVINSKTFTHQIDISFLSPGSYIVEVIGSKQKWSQVLIKQ